VYAAVLEGVYDKVEDLNKAISYQNNPTRNYELELK